MHAGPALRRAAEPGQPRRLAVALEIHHQREPAPAHPPEQGECLRQDVQGVPAAIAGTIQHEGLIHLPEAFQQRRILGRDQKRDPRTGKRLPQQVNRGESEHDVTH